MDISKQRQQIHLLYRQMGACLKILLSRPPMVRGIVYELKRKCGKPNCRCTRGELHSSPCLSYYIGGGKRKLTTLKGSDVAKYRKLTENYQRFYHARAEFLKLSREIIDGLKKIEEERIMSYEESKDE